MFKTYFFALLIAGMVTGNAIAAEEGALFGDWKVKCEQAADDTRVCHIFQRVTMKESNQQLLNMAVGYGRTEDHQAIALFTLPLGIALPPGVAFRIEEGEPQKVPFTVCTQDGCRAALKLSDAMIAALKKGNNATLTFATLEPKGFNIPISLKGFTKGFDSLKP